MRSLRVTLLRLRGLLDRGRHDREFDAELESHLALHVDDNRVSRLGHSWRAKLGQFS